MDDMSIHEPSTSVFAEAFRRSSAMFLPLVHQRPLADHSQAVPKLHIRWPNASRMGYCVSN